ncbi:MAG: TRAP transporter substrate-binding protein [Clostridiaceae bacterium]|nr:TRAP transporter substrate-binding protein [Clostridiaceae bacterium]
MKKRYIVYLLILTMVVGLLAGCGSSSQPSTTNEQPADSGKSASDEKKVVIRLGYLPEVGSIDDLAANAFKDYVEKESNGSIEVRLFPGSQLGGETELTEQCKMGTTEMIAVGEISAINVVPEYAEILRVPYVFDSYEHLQRFLAQPMGTTSKTIAQLVQEKAGIRTLCYYNRGSRQMTSNKPIYKLEDLKGLKLRVPSIAISVASWKLTGAVPTSVEAGELYMGLQQGIVEAQENPVDFINSKSLNEVQKYLIKTNHQYGLRWILINEKFYQSMSENQKNIMEAGAKLYAETGDMLLAKMEKSIQEDLIKKGMTLIDSDKIDIDAIRKVILAELPNLGSKWDPSVIDTVEKTR